MCVCTRVARLSVTTYGPMTVPVALYPATGTWGVVLPRVCTRTGVYEYIPQHIRTTMLEWYLICQFREWWDNVCIQLQSW